MNQSILFVNIADAHYWVKMSAAKKLGLQMFLVAPDLPDWAKELVDYFIQADTTNCSETLAVLRQVYQDRPFHGVITLLDKSVELVAAIAQEFNLPGSTREAANYGEA